MTNPAPVTAGQIADLLTWARSLAEQGAAADPGERTAFLAAKHELLGRLTSGQHDTGQHDTGQHDTGQHDTGQHDTGQHDTGQHDTGRRH